MKPKDKKDKYLHDKLEELDGPIPDTCKKQIREAKRRVKRQISKKGRLEGKRAVRDFEDE